MKFNTSESNHNTFDKSTIFKRKPDRQNISSPNIGSKRRYSTKVNGRSFKYCVEDTVHGIIFYMNDLTDVERLYERLGT